MTDSARRGLPLLSGPPPAQNNSSRAEIACRKCNKEFNILFTRRTRCNHCGYSYCSSCTDYQALMPRSSPNHGYEVMPVCAFCVENLTITAAGRAQLRAQPLSRLRKYVEAYQINVQGAIEKDDYIDHIISARGANGCLSSTHEDYYRKYSVPNRPPGTRPRGLFSRLDPTQSSQSQSHTSPRTPPRRQQNQPPAFPRPDLEPDQPQPPPGPPPSQRPTFARPDLEPDPPFQPPLGPPPSQRPTFARPDLEPDWPFPPPGPLPSQRPSFARPDLEPDWPFQSPSGPPPSQQWQAYNTTSAPPPQPQTPNYPADQASYQQPQPFPTARPRAQSPPPRPTSAQNLHVPPSSPPRRDARVRATSAAPAVPPSAPPTLDELLNMQIEGIKALSIGVLKAVLFQNHVNARLIIEKGDLVDKVITLVEDERRERDRRAREEELEAIERAMMEEYMNQEAQQAEDEGSKDGLSFDSTPPQNRPLPPKAQAMATTLERNGLCVICQDEDANIAIVDCGHLAMCRGCSDLIMASSKECPLCRTRIVTEARLLRIYKT